MMSVESHLVLLLREKTIKMGSLSAFPAIHVVIYSLTSFDLAYGHVTGMPRRHLSDATSNIPIKSERQYVSFFVHSILPSMCSNIQ